MPTQVLPDQAGFDWLERVLTRHSFLVASHTEVVDSIIQNNVVASRPKSGQEIGFYFEVNGLGVWVWTSWDRKKAKAREEDAGWVVITENGKAKYFSHEIRRTAGFLRRLALEARVAQLRILARPHCRECGSFMRIWKGKRLKARYWGCSRRALHEGRKVVTADWDVGLPEKAVKYKEKQRRARRKYKERMAAEGKSPTPVVLTRSAWHKKDTKSSSGASES